MRYLQMLFAVSAIGLFVVACGGEATGEEITTAEVAQGADSCNCPAVIAPVCGEDGKDYNNECEANCAGTKVAHPGKCHCICPTVIDPVCGVDGKQYNNSCEAGCAGVEVDYDGPCKVAVHP
jgi:coxsackievirus/adenovirus receptor